MDLQTTDRSGEAGGTTTRDLYMSMMASWSGSLCMGTALGYSSPATESLEKEGELGAIALERDLFW